MEELLSTLFLALLLVIQISQGFRLTPVDLPHETNDIEDSDLFFDKEEMEPEMVTAQMGGRVVLTCEAGGSPSPTIHWLFNGERILQNGDNRIENEEAFLENNQHNKGMPTLRIGSTKSRLFIDCVTEAHQGDYTCVADEPTRRIAKVTKVRVASTFTGDEVLLSTCLSKRQHQASAPARIFMWTAHRLEIEGADVQMFCRASGNPTPTTTWIMLDKEGNELPLDSDQYEILENGDLFVHEISFTGNMGTYRCVAENVHGKDSADAFLYPTAFGKK